MKEVFDAVSNLGLPVVLAVLLVLHFLKMNKALTNHNSRLLEELSELRGIAATTLETLRTNDNLLRQNTELHAALRISEQASIDLVRQCVDALLAAKADSKRKPR